MFVFKWDGTIVGPLIALENEVDSESEESSDRVGSVEFALCFRAQTQLESQVWVVHKVD